MFFTIFSKVFREIPSLVVGYCEGTLRGCKSCVQMRLLKRFFFRDLTFFFLILKFFLILPAKNFRKSEVPKI